MTEWIRLDGVIHVKGKCCGRGRGLSPCAKCGGIVHMTGGYMGPLLACESCDEDWKAGDASIVPHVED